MCEIDDDTERGCIILMAGRYNIIQAMFSNGQVKYVKSVSEKYQSIEFTDNIYEARHFPFDFDKACGWIDELTTYPVSMLDGITYCLNEVC